MPKLIVFSGHGDWGLGSNAYVKIPNKCSMKFYTMNAKTLSDGLGGDIDRGIVAGLDPDQEAGPFKTVPDMTLYPPTGLNIQRPDSATWHIVTLPTAVPADDKHIQVQIDKAFPGGATLSVMFSFLDSAIRQADSVVFLWAACRAVKLRNAGGDKLGVNRLQR